MSGHLMGVYNRAPVEVERGEGARLYATDGTAYLDCVAGIATNSLGHRHPRLVQALKDQADKLWHTSNIFRIPGQEALADRLTAESFADVVFFANSGTEAVEAAIKTARRYHYANGNTDRIDIIGFDGSFHGRTYAAINAAGNPSYVEGFGPRLPGYVQVTFGDMEAIKVAIDSPTAAAVILEPVQGEGGARASPTPTCARSASGATTPACCWCWTRCSPAWAAPASCGPTNGPGSPRTSWPWPRRWAAASPSAPAWPPPRRPRAWWPACTAPPSAAIPWPWPWAMPPWTRSPGRKPSPMWRRSPAI
ncbi:acetylornithine aminotransferase [Brevundimonas abyssalis TAR-001]|uniref:Acetylornithine aminotransferase n=1 Tax=Brevundimonas abyssalis TAR-001 TaxID=1391729 RepID=A0A8E0TSH1_9CAUL|nr:acetylornithine aminotransferase [Brevundimonas abyssalis TAR-001]